MRSKVKELKLNLKFQFIFAFVTTSLRLYMSPNLAEDKFLYTDMSRFLFSVSLAYFIINSEIKKVSHLNIIILVISNSSSIAINNFAV